MMQPDLAAAPVQPGALRAPADAPLRLARREAIAATMEQVRRLERSQGVCRHSLGQMKGLLLELAAQAVLFAREDFPCAGGTAGRDPIYLLSQDAGQRFALYLYVGSPGKKVQPHNHTTWAVITGIRGYEENFFYERTDDGSVPGRARLRCIGQQTVKPGQGVCMMPADIHHIETGADQEVNWHLHLYGLALPQLHRRLNFNLEDGSYQMYASTPPILDARPQLV